MQCVEILGSMRGDFEVNGRDSDVQREALFKRKSVLSAER